MITLRDPPMVVLDAQHDPESKHDREKKHRNHMGRQPLFLRSTIFLKAIFLQGNPLSSATRSIQTLTTNTDIRPHSAFTYPTTLMSLPLEDEEQYL